ncbi:hypothetical protein DL96DRAFT_1672691 [Flagelloscypha sp. PMI_526]|nr:hypothetical protein DL96DRAFT_1672691 [Flagelloscypha sp. PMI_526]
MNHTLDGQWLTRHCDLFDCGVPEQMGNLEHATSAYENELKDNPNSLPGLTKVAGIACMEYFHKVWIALGKYCYLMPDVWQQAYAAYQQAVYFLLNPEEDLKLLNGISILYDCYGSLGLAEEAFLLVLRMNRAYSKTKDASECVSADIPLHTKVWQHLGWLYHQEGSTFRNQELAIHYLMKILDSGKPSDSQPWYLLVRAYTAGQNWNPTSWCSISMLHFQINQLYGTPDTSHAVCISSAISVSCDNRI